MTKLGGLKRQYFFSLPCRLPRLSRSSPQCWLWPLLRLYWAESSAGAETSRMASLKTGPAPGVPAMSGDWWGLSSRGDRLSHGDSWCQKQSRSHQASSTIFCCQSKSQGRSRFRGRENKLHALTERAECTTARGGLLGSHNCRQSIKT